MVCGDQAPNILNRLEEFFWGNTDEFLAWLADQLGERAHAFERAVVDADMEQLMDFAKKRESRVQAGGQLALI